MGTTQQLTLAQREETLATLLKRVWAEVREIVGEQVDVVDAAALALLTPGATFEPLNAERMAHRLAGSLGSFGLPVASDDARELEALFGGLTEATANATTTLRVADLAVGLREHVAYLDRALMPAPSGAGEDVFFRPVVNEIDLRPVELAAVDVAVVEDDPVTAELIMHALRQNGLSTKVLSDGLEASEALGGRLPLVRARVVLLDVDLPSLNGLDVLRHLDRTGALEQTKVIMLTARCGESETIQAFDLGAIDFVAKPFSHEVLVRRVQLALA